MGRSGGRGIGEARRDPGSSTREVVVGDSFGQTLAAASGGWLLRSKPQAERLGAQGETEGQVRSSISEWQAARGVVPEPEETPNQPGGAAHTPWSVRRCILVAEDQGQAGSTTQMQILR